MSGGIYSDKTIFVHRVTIAMNSRQTITSGAGDKTFINAVSPGGIISSVNEKVVKINIILSIRFVNIFAGDNNIAAGTWKIKIGGEAYAVIPFPMPGGNGVMQNGDWDCQVEGGGGNVGYIADVTSLVKAETLASAVSVQLKGAQSAQDSIDVEVSAWYEVVLKNAI